MYEDGDTPVFPYFAAIDASLPPVGLLDSALYDNSEVSALKHAGFNSNPSPSGSGLSNRSVQGSTTPCPERVVKLYTASALHNVKGSHTCSPRYLLLRLFAFLQCLNCLCL